jgi:plasmid stabilization system protein ParE
VRRGRRRGAEDVARLELTHGLPAATYGPIRRSVQALGRFPRLGTLLEERGWEGFRFVLGPWRWMVIVYDSYEDEDRVVIVTVLDGRSSGAAPGSR